MFLTYQYGLRPTRQQYRRLEAILEGQRLLYNAALEERSQAWRKSHKSVTRIAQTKSLTTIRADDPQGYGALPVTLSRWSLKKVDEAFQAFFRRITAKCGKAGFPRFKSRHRWRSFGFCEFSGIRLIDGALVFKGMPGRLYLHLHRRLIGQCLDPLLHAHQARPRLARRAPDRGGGRAHGPPRSQ